MITAAMKGELDQVNYTPHRVFGVLMPDSVPGVPSEILHPRNTWADKDAYDQKAMELAKLFVNNFEKYASEASAETMAAAPKTEILV